MTSLLPFLILVDSTTTSTSSDEGSSNDRSSSTSSSRSGSPNFIVFFVDDLGYGDLGFTGHPTTETPNLDRLAFNGKILTTWYSGCNVCTGSRASLMTGRQFARTGLPGVIGPSCSYGLNLNEVTIAEQLKKANYSTAIVGKWHLGQRKVYLPGSRGFDYYLGIPFSDDMGIGRESTCPAEQFTKEETVSPIDEKFNLDTWSARHMYEEMGLMKARLFTSSNDSIEKLQQDKDKPDKGTKWLPLVYQEFNQTRIVEQPVDFTTLAEKYSNFATSFIENNKDSPNPFFLYVPFSHVHTTEAGTTTENQYVGCKYRNSTKRGIFGDALAETDWITGNIVQKVRDLGLEEDTLILFTSDNGPWAMRGSSAGSEGLFTGRFAEGYKNTAKGSNWEGGIREPAFAYWKVSITPFTRTSEIISSLDVFPTLSALAGLPLPQDRPFDGKDMSEILLNEDGKSDHDFLFFYGTCSGEEYYSISSVRHGKYKAHWCTAPGLGHFNESLTKRYDPPLLFDIEKDPSEAEPISFNQMPTKKEDLMAMNRILKAYAMEKSTFQFGNITQEPDGPGEEPGKYALCCDRSRECYCNDRAGIFNLGTKEHHGQYHKALGNREPSPPINKYQNMLQSLE
ncbi:alkaline phosphatase-like protein [Fragilariopsis cylindrus CCMP1102]|uniref:Alkaline phosphatase-like protein n=1 Tax=Fragilariopsis cylindrus CCMP1102 TaxID=635003 RepID=A0A1E7FT66_9STRA|nr:alkaline phosphatase-like protein [Fragilariopsis cylindrus CCMP1102]|eukprot:OEU21348.1 alkaline phosphatase-like protein [Fragilariopsis cylindrus CCMP1102]